MEEHEIAKLMLKRPDGYEILLEKPVHHHLPPPPHYHSTPSNEVAEANENAPEKTGAAITSPMVGTFYGSPSPQDPPFVKVGEKVNAVTIVCIIEAMKVMNEVKAGQSGVISKVLIENGHPVEYGTKLFEIQ